MNRDRFRVHPRTIVAERILSEACTLPVTARMVALAIASRMRTDKHESYPGHKDISARTGICVRKVQDCIRLLCDSPTPYFHRRRRGRGYLYVLAPHVGGTAAPGSENHRHDMPASRTSEVRTAGEYRHTLPESDADLASDSDQNRHHVPANPLKRIQGERPGLVAKGNQPDPNPNLPERRGGDSPNRPNARPERDAPSPEEIDQGVARMSRCFSAAARRGSGSGRGA
jgi:hypothetical protein